MSYLQGRDSFVSNMKCGVSSGFILAQVTRRRPRGRPTLHPQAYQGGETGLHSWAWLGWGAGLGGCNVWKELFVPLLIQIIITSVTMCGQVISFVASVGTEVGSVWKQSSSLQLLVIQERHAAENWPETFVSLVSPVFEQQVWTSNSHTPPQVWHFVGAFNSRVSESAYLDG